VGRKYFGCVKGLAQVVENTLVVRKDLGSSLMYAICVLFELFLFCFGYIIVTIE